jgi:hypothetical protein
MMAHQKKHGYKSATATVAEGNVVKEAWLFDMDSTYLLKGQARCSKQEIGILGRPDKATSRTCGGRHTEA